MRKWILMLVCVLTLSVLSVCFAEDSDNSGEVTAQQSYPKFVSLVRNVGVMRRSSSAKSPKWMENSIHCRDLHVNSRCASIMRI